MKKVKCEMHYGNEVFRYEAELDPDEQIEFVPYVLTKQCPVDVSGGLPVKLKIFNDAGEEWKVWELHLKWVLVKR